MTERLHQLNIHFDPVEDRLLLRMSVAGSAAPAEYRLWLTRRFVSLLWQSLHRALDNAISADQRVAPSGREAVRRFQQESALAQADFATPYAEQDAVTPLGERPVLVSRARIGRSPQGGQVIHLEAADGPALHINLNDQMMHAFMKLLADGARNAQWGLHLPLSTEAGSAPAQGIRPS